MARLIQERANFSSKAVLPYRFAKIDAAAKAAIEGQLVGDLFGFCIIAGHEHVDGFAVVDRVEHVFEACGIETFDYGPLFCLPGNDKRFCRSGPFMMELVASMMTLPLTSPIWSMISNTTVGGVAISITLCLLYCIRYGMHGCIVVLKQVLAFEILDIVGAQ